jgi:hypothetical protein
VNLVFSVADGQGYHAVMASVPPSWQTGVTYTAKAVLRPNDALALEVAKQKGNGKLVIYATSTDPNAVLTITAIPIAAGQPPIGLGTMAKTTPNGNEFFPVKKGCRPSALSRSPRRAEDLRRQR